MDNRHAIISELARAIGLLSQGADDDAHTIIRTLARGISDQRTLPGIAPAQVKVSAESARKMAALELFRYWQNECQHEAARPTIERTTAIMARLREGYTVAEIRKAIDGAKHAAFVSPDNGKRHDDLTLICRSGSKLEAFIERGEKHTGSVVVESVSASTGGLEEQIAALRRSMVTLKRDGRVTEYQDSGRQLMALMAQRSNTEQKETAP